MAQDYIDTIQAEIQAALTKEKSASKEEVDKRSASTKQRVADSMSTTQDLASLMTKAVRSTAFSSIVQHPDFPALASDQGVQSLVGALTNRVGSILS
jgi:hypothetical protein